MNAKTIQAGDKVQIAGEVVDVDHLPSATCYTIVEVSGFDYILFRGYGAKFKARVGDKVQLAGRVERTATKDDRPVVWLTARTQAAVIIDEDQDAQDELRLAEEDVQYFEAQHSEAKRALAEAEDRLEELREREDRYAYSVELARKRKAKLEARHGRGPKTTAQLRAEAAEAEEAGDWSTAATLLREAAARYPTAGAMADADKAALLQRAADAETVG